MNVVTITGVKKLYKMGSEIAAALNGADLKIDEGEFSLIKISVKIFDYDKICARWFH